MPKTKIVIKAGGAEETEGFFGKDPVDQPTVTGAKGGNAALTSLIQQLAAMGLIKDSTS